MTNINVKIPRRIYSQHMPPNVVNIMPFNDEIRRQVQGPMQ